MSEEFLHAHELATKVEFDIIDQYVAKIQPEIRLAMLEGYTSYHYYDGVLPSIVRDAFRAKGYTVTQECADIDYTVIRW